jgi:hypothetical protein
MTGVLIVHQFEILIINVFEMQIGFIILQVSTNVEVPLSRSKLGPVSSVTWWSQIITHVPGTKFELCSASLEVNNKVKDCGMKKESLPSCDQ